ncbi:MAG: YggT family protein [Candidatus Caldatribacteriota bacterium]|nr:YggT family protein [Atribacterota bacterium]MDD3640551.1 YggT family protein [Atribacterota bacterium]MDD4288037.1 YggT family protein [Atribacterota bacterium]MDD4764450.1 YggT family protein [Atribacterota bacterium]MDI9596148.1 YggT family protein [Atribacterota bacterium]
MYFLINIINIVFRIYSYIILARIFLSWLPVDRSNPIIKLIYQATEPILAPFRVIIPLGGMGIDLSPIIVYFLLNLLRTSLIRLIVNIYY